MVLMSSLINILPVEKNIEIKTGSLNNWVYNTLTIPENFNNNTNKETSGFNKRENKNAGDSSKEKKSQNYDNELPEFEEFSPDMLQDAYKRGYKGGYESGKRLKNWLFSTMPND